MKSISFVNRGLPLLFDYLKLSERPGGLFGLVIAETHLSSAL